MSKLFTPEEFKKLDPGIINNLIERNISFIVSEKHDLGSDYTWCSFRETIIKKETLKDKEIDLTRKEKDFIKLLVEANGAYVNYDIILRKIWKDKKATIYTIRNFINHIRAKTFYEIIKTKSNLGYKVKSNRKS